MRGITGCALIALAAVSSCKREPTFDERYAGAQKAIRQKASALDQDMGKRASDAKAIASQDSETDSPPVRD